MVKLAINGGEPVRKKCFPNQNSIGAEEKQAAMAVLDRGRLSGYRGNAGPAFLGGDSVQKFEQEFSEFVGNKYTSIAVNSCTSGLQIACLAIGLKPGDEVIVTPWSMTCSATAPLICGATPVFADIEKDHYCLDPESVKSKITKHTKAIIAVSLFGQPYDPKINEIAKEHGLYVIEDAAQAIGSGIVYDGKYRPAGTLGDIGVYSFTYGKHLTAGEGGMIITVDPDLAYKCCLLRNHAESVINDLNTNPSEIYPKSFSYGMSNLYGFNMRLTEIQAAILSEQLKKLDFLIYTRVMNAQVLNSMLSEIPAIETMKVRKGCFHSLYVLPFQWNKKKADGLHRNFFIEAVKAELQPREQRESEGIQIGCGYIKPLYLMPIFNKEKGLCPACEDLWKNRFFLTLYHAPNSTVEDMKDLGEAFLKVWENRDELK